MAIRLGTNIDSLAAQRGLNSATSALSQSYERLSSGLRINQASDDPAGLALVSQLNAQTTVYTQAIRNVNDGVSVANIAEGALNSLKQISQRQLELAEEAANGTYSLTQRQALNKEANALVDEYNRIVGSTTFNGMSLLDPSLGTVLIQSGYGSAGAMQLQLSNQLQRATGNGTFQSPQTIATAGTAPNAITLSDVNGDGKLDMITTDSGNHDMSVFLGNGDGTFQAAKSYQTNSSPISVATGDFNGDGITDIVTADNQFNNVSVFIGNGDGTFQVRKGFNTLGSSLNALAVGDINGDGKLDIVTANYLNNSISVLFGNGNGTFQTAQTMSDGGSGANDIILRDINGDGNLDVVDIDDVSNTVDVLLGNGNGTFKTPVTIATHGVLSQTVTLGDFNNDGTIDIATGNTGTNNFNVFFGNGDGTFGGEITLAAAAISPGWIDAGDVNGDGITDLVGSVYFGTVDVFISNGNGTFQAAKSISGVGSGLVGLQLGDVNNDGGLDIVTADFAAASASVVLGNTKQTSATPYLDIASQQGARDALTTVTNNLNRIEAQLGTIGATTSRFQYEIGNLQSKTENFAAAAAQIQDVDVAQESANLVREQILQQAATAILAQANQEPSLVLKLFGA